MEGSWDITFLCPSIKINHRIKHGKAISTNTLDEICFVLDCRVEDVLKYEKR